MDSSIATKVSPKLELPIHDSPKDKRYVTQVEKAIATFYLLEEWADYITFLSRLLKALALPVKPRSATWLPLQDQVLNKLALCLSPDLPSGVHQKALLVYGSIFDSLTLKELNNLIFIWLPGLLLMLSYGSTLVKPQLLSLYELKILPHLDAKTLKSIAKPILLSLLSGLDDENSEIFADCLRLLEVFKESLSNNTHFWQELFLCIISNPEKRMGALNWCLAHLPMFSTIQLESGMIYSSEAQACLSDKGGLLIRAFASALDTKTTFNPATDIIVIRGFFDLLLARLPLKSPVFTSLVNASDKQILVMACVKTTLKKEMSLNRRLWAWFLGALSSNEGLDSSSRKEYFSTHALSFVEKGISSLLNSSLSESQICAIRMSLSLIIDKWEISQLVTPLIFTSILKKCKDAVDQDNQSKEILHETKLFFNQVEAFYIWRYVTCDLIQSNSREDAEMLQFILKYFDLPDDSSSVHIHLAILVYILDMSLDENSLVILEALANLARPDLLVSEEHTEESELGLPHVLKAIKQFYEDLSQNENASLSIQNLTISYFLLKGLKTLYISALLDERYTQRISSLLSEFVYSVPRIEGLLDDGDIMLKNAILDLPVKIVNDLPLNNNSNAYIFGVYKLSRYLVSIMSYKEKSRLIQIIMSNFWEMICSEYPACNQVESVRGIFDLQSCFDHSEIEAGLVTMILKTPETYKYKAFELLWIHSVDIKESSSILASPLYIILDGLKKPATSESIDLQRFLLRIIRENCSQRMLQNITEPLIQFLITWEPNKQLSTNDDLSMVSYYLQTLNDVICTNKKTMKDALSKESIAAETLYKFEALSKSWNVSSYRSLVLRIATRFTSLRINALDAANEVTFASFSHCTSLALALYITCISGSDSNFDELFSASIDTCMYYIGESKTLGESFDNFIHSYLIAIRDTLHMAKSLNVALRFVTKTENEELPKLASFVIDCISVCNSPRLLDSWFQLSSSMLHVLKGSILKFLSNLVSAIIDKIKSLFEALKSFQRLENGNKLEESILVLMTGLENIMILVHSHIARSTTSTSSISAPSENGFLGNVISGVFQIEAPQAKSEEERIFSDVLDVISATSLTAYELWNWADSQAGMKLPETASQQSVKYLTNRIRFRSRKLLESASDLERQRVIETIVLTPMAITSKVKVLHILDSGQAQTTIPHILTAIKGKCYPQILPERERMCLSPHTLVEDLSSFLSPYLESVDYDIIDDQWNYFVKFFKDVIAHISHFNSIILDILDVMKTIAIKTKGRNSSYKEMAIFYSSCFSSILTKRSELNDFVMEKDFNEKLILHINDFPLFLQDHDKTSALITATISTIITPKLKSKVESFDSSLPRLLEVIGQNYPVKAWKQLINDVFVDNSFFAAERYTEDEWKKCFLLWIINENEKLSEFVARVTPHQQAAAANLFLWNDSSEIQNSVLCLKRLAYLFLILPIDAFGPRLNDLFSRLGLAWKSTTSSLVKSQIFTLLRAITLRFSDSHLVDHWSFFNQSIAESILSFLDLTTKELSALVDEPLSLLLSSCKLLDQLLLLNFDEFNMTSWVFVGDGSIAEDISDSALIDRLAKKTESLMSKHTPILVTHPTKGELSVPLLTGIREIKNTAMLKVFLGLLSYINYERTYGLCKGSITACEAEVLADLIVRRK